MTGAKTLLSDELQAELERVACEQNRQPVEVLEDAVRKYLDERSWVRVLEYGQERAKAVGIATEERIDQAIADLRRENRRAR